MNTYARNYLLNKGYKLPDTDMYTKIEQWKAWLENDVSFHNYTDYYGTKRRMYSLGMAERVCEDWASIIFSEKDDISVDKKKNEEFIKNYMKDNNLRDKIINDIIIASALGTVATIQRIKNVLVKGESIEPTSNTELDMVTVTADKIIPLKVINGEIIDCAFISDSIIDEKKAIYIEIHTLTKDRGYHIENVYLDKRTGKELKNQNVIRSFYTNSDIPLFSILEPPVFNGYEDNNGLGYSVYANGNDVDQLKAIDIAYHNYVMDTILGGKKIIYNKKLLKYKEIKTIENGKEITREIPVYPDDVMKQQWADIGDGLDNTAPMITEYNPSLRTEENKSNIQFALDLLSFKCGLGNRYYNFTNGVVVTATQYAGDRQDLLKNAKKYRNKLDSYISGIIKSAIIYSVAILGNKDLTTDCTIMVSNKDGILVTDEERNQQLREELNMGLISKITYLTEVNNWTEERAKQELQKVEEEKSINYTEETETE